MPTSRTFRPVRELRIHLWLLLLLSKGFGSEGGNPRSSEAGKDLQDHRVQPVSDPTASPEQSPVPPWTPAHLPEQPLPMSSVSIPGCPARQLLPEESTTLSRGWRSLGVAACFLSCSLPSLSRLVAVPGCLLHDFCVMISAQSPRCP